jgi:hypothetical protein
MNGYPHGIGHPSRNGFPGHFCIHFYGSRIHRTGAVDPGHQAAIRAAARTGAAKERITGTGGEGVDPTEVVPVAGPED